MSEAVFSHLPRFDAVSGLRPADWLRAMQAGETPASAPSAARELPEPPPQVKSEPTEVRVVPQETAALQAAVANLSKLMERIETESRQQTVETVQRIAAQLFPELSRRFLAEEIGRHLPGLLPASVPGVDIYAEPRLATQLQEIVQKNPSLEGRCNVVPREGQGEGRAEVSWRTGGVSFDFEGLLTDCLNDLGSTHKKTTETR